MEEALRFFRAYEVWIYMLLGLGGLIYIRRFSQAWQELREAAFGLERESAAQARLNQSASMLVLLLALSVTLFMLVSFIAPTLPGAIPLLTPTLDLLATATPPLPATESPEANGAPAQATPSLASTPAGAGPAGGCIPGQVIIGSPKDGSEISGVVTITGTATIPNFGFFKLEMKRPDETNWLTILAGNEVKVKDTLGVWNTSLLPPGDHELSLVVTDNQGASMPPCIVQVRVTNAAPQP